MSRQVNYSEAASRPYSPNVAEPSGPEAPLPTVPGNGPWLFKAHPLGDLAVLGSPGAEAVVPILRKMALVPGIAGVAADKRTGRMRVRQALQSQGDRGWIVIPHDVDGPGTSYLREVAPGLVLSRFETVYAGSGEVQVDEDAFVDWTRSLITRGILPPPSPAKLAKLRRRTAETLAIAQDRARDVPSMRAMVDKLTRHIAVIDAEIEATRRPAIGDVLDPFAGTDLDERGDE